MPARKLFALVVMCTVVGIGGGIAAKKIFLQEDPPADPQPIVASATTENRNLPPDVKNPPAYTPAPPPTPANPVYGFPDLWVHGFVVRGRQVNVYLSDGSIIDNLAVGEPSEQYPKGKPLLESVQRNFVIVAGKRIPILRGRLPGAASTVPLTSKGEPREPIRSEGGAVDLLQSKPLAGL